MIIITIFTPYTFYAPFASGARRCVRIKNQLPPSSFDTARSAATSLDTPPVQGMAEIFRFWYNDTAQTTVKLEGDISSLDAPSAQGMMMMIAFIITLGEIM